MVFGRQVFGIDPGHPFPKTGDVLISKIRDRDNTAIRVRLRERHDNKAT